MRAGALILLSILMCCLAAPTMAAECKFKAGDYAGIEWAGADSVPVVILDVLEGCRYSVRFLPDGSDHFDIDIQSTSDEWAHPLAAPPEGIKPFGCPFAKLDPLDVKIDNDWRRALATEVNSDCSMQGVYVAANGLGLPFDIGRYDYEEVRHNQLPPLSVAEANQLLAQTADHVDCPAGDNPSSFGEGPVAEVKKSIIAEIMASRKSPDTKNQSPAVTVNFEGVRSGVARPVTSEVMGLYPDAAIGGLITPYRATLRYCVATRPLREDHHVQADYYCYDDPFGDLICHKFKEAELP